MMNRRGESDDSSELHVHRMPEVLLAREVSCNRQERPEVTVLEGLAVGLLEHLDRLPDVMM